MRSLKTHFLQSQAVIVLLLGFIHSPAWATGTASGTVISNVATLTYFLDGASAEVLSSPTGNPKEAGISTAFTVSSKINVAVTAVGSAAVNVTPGQAGAVATFSVTNTGNTTQDYALSVSNLASGVALFTGTDEFDAADCKVIAETNGQVGYQPEADTAAFIDELQQDTSKAVYVVCDIPAGQAGGEAVIDLVATVRAGLTTGALGGDVAKDLFADAAGSDDAIGDGKYSARNAYLLTPR